MIDLEKERKVFEKWVKKQCPQIQWELKNKTDGEYDSGSMSWAWEAWSYKQAEIDTLKAKLAKVESGEFVIMPKSEIGHYYYDEIEGMYIDEPDSFLTDLWYGDVQEVKRRDYFDLPTQYAANVYTDEDNISWKLFDLKEDAEKAAAHCKAMIESQGN